MLWIFLALLLLAEPILAKESDVQPNQQVQHLTSLINGAILAEGVITSELKIDEMTTDWVIVDSMPRDKDWISSLESNPQLAEIQEMLGQLGPFLNVIKNGYKKDVPMDQLEKVAKLTQAVQSVPKLAMSSQKVLETFENHFKSFPVDVGQYSQAVQFVEFLPRAIPYLREASNNDLLAETVQNGIDFINAVKKIDVNKIQESLNECSKQDAHNTDSTQFFACEVSLYTEIQKVSKVPNGADIEKSAYFIRAYYYAENTQYFSKFIKDRAEIVEMRKTLQNLLAVVDSFSKTPDEKFVAEIFKNVKELKSNEAKMQSLQDAIDEFKIISEVISKISSHQSADNKQKAKSSNRFNSYRGFPNGAESLRDLLTVSGSESKLPRKYRNAQLSERTASIKVWMDKMGNLMNNARGLIGFFEISSNAQSVGSFVKKSPETDTGDTTLSDFFRSLSSRNISEAINALAYIEDQIAFFEKSAWTMKLYGSMTIKKWMKGLEDWNEPFWTMPTVFDFFNRALEDFKEAREGKVNFNADTDRIEFHKKFMPHLNSYIESVPSLMNFSLVVQESAITSENLAEQVNEMKDQLVVLKDIEEKDLPPPGSLSMERLQAGLDAFTKLKTATKDFRKTSTAPLEKFLRDLEDVEALKKTILPLSASFNFTTTKTLLETLAGSSIGEIPGISGEANDILANLMAGNPFGAEVLQDLATGVSSFHKLVGGIDVSKLAEELSLVKADGEANGAIGKLVDGAEYVQIPADPSNVYSMFADDVKLPEHIKKLSDWISRILEAEHQTEKAYLEQNKDKFGSLHALIYRVKKPMDAEFKLLSDRIEYIFRVLQDDGKLGSGSIIIIVIVVLLLVGLSAGGAFFGYKRWAKSKAKSATSKETVSSKKDNLKKERKDEKKGKSVANGSKEVV